MPEHRPARKVTFRHRVVVEFETTGTTGYNEGVEYLVEEAKKHRARFKVLVLPLDAEVTSGGTGAMAAARRVSEAGSTVHVEIDT